ncbi:hypothetical protein DBR36_09615 [Microbacterium sp. HMWF026]|uniref:hypothetical protein n=1 Tax=Microbacterium sp. HMWF026 TaxID=2056861 RepID=UPI000D356541|nr:hypothetical protein [Microbacterium sp. HMWF026]PTT18261.1 hypothetical protein DBR36_09615 [Microbacterium sp. HMWF026]
MSGPYDRADDPDEVTLWAGRLRAWPTPPPAVDDVDDDTVLSRSVEPDDDTVLSRAVEPDDDTVLSAGESAADDTVRSVGEPAADDTVLSRAVELVEDEGEDAETTAPRRAAPAAPDAQPLDDARIDEATRPRRRIDEADGGDTEAGSRRSRRQAAQPEPEVAALPVNAARQPLTPAALARETYAPHRDHAVRVSRSPVAPVRSERDASVVRPRRRRGAARVVTLVVVVAVVVAAAAIGLALLLG